MIKLIASDMDGTLLGSNHDISEENIKAIKLAQENGIHFAISTGRAYDDVKPFIEKYDLNCECAALNGGEYIDKEGNIIESVYIDHEKARDTLDEMLKFNLQIEIYTDKGYYTTSTKEEMMKGMLKRAKAFNPEIKDEKELHEEALKNPHFVNMNYISDIGEFFKSDVKIGKFVSFAETVEEIQEVKDHMSKIDGLAISSSFETNIEINHEDATKGKILLKAAEKMGITREEVAVFGDSYNDYTMFKEFPNSYAMKNAIPMIKEAAGFITDKNTEDGVAKGIYKILQNQESIINA
ncbi:MAG: Cof-type HAD-IIB family hydrolase [Clostridium sp.]|nr:Cof-type HAD-IIB family hydrolase [Clostridium sp.]